jgi:hypothetical protein
MADDQHRADRARLPPGMTPRLLTRDQAAAYCGISPAHFTETIAREVPAVMVRATMRWDVRALDRWIDTKAGLYDGSERQRSIAERLNADQNSRR